MGRIERTTALAEALAQWGIAFDAERKANRIIAQGVRLSPSAIADCFDRLRTYGLAASDLRKMAARFPGIAFCGTDTVMRALDNLEERGFVRSRVLAIVRREPSVAAYAPERVNGIFAGLEGLGFSGDEVRSITERFPALLNSSFVRTKGIVMAMFRRLKSADVVRSVILTNPNVIGYALDRIDQSLDAFEVLGWDPVTMARRFTFAPGLLRARHAYLNGRGICATSRMMKMSNREFEQRFGIGRTELLRLDPGPEAFRALARSPDRTSTST